MPKVVSITTPIISLLKIDKLHLLMEIYQEIIIPIAVFNEIEKGKNKDYYTDITQIEWIHILDVQDKKALNYFLDLDRGEAEAIVLANEISADLIIIDELMGRHFASKSNLKITGTLGVLLKAKSMGLIEAVLPLVKELKEKEIWFSNSLIEQISGLVGENI